MDRRSVYWTICLAIFRPQGKNMARRGKKTYRAIRISTFPKRKHANHLRGYRSAISSRYAGHMKNRSEATFSRETAGLCVDCINMRRVESSRGSIFVLCDLSRDDPRFLKYPRLPVLACEGYRPQT
jgi:hypothetical protein